ncbi:MAG: ywaD [Planctomycetaceae bacterium]|nr:ywaD [Planctomycetaceae bacterium]
MTWMRSLILSFGAGCLFVVTAALLPAADTVAESEQRLLKDVKFLASDELEGRGIGLKGLDLAAEHIRTEFEKAGLNVTAVKGGAFQPFEMTTSAKLGGPHSLVFSGPEGKKLELKMEADFIPLSFSASGKFSGDLVFAGYGIDAKAEKSYSDYEGLDVKGKVVLIMRREPRQGDDQKPGLAGPHGGQSKYADLRTKVSTAYGNGAVGILFVDDPYSSREALGKSKQQLTKQGENVAEALLTTEATPATDEEKSKTSKQALVNATNRYKELKAEVAAGAPDKLMRFGYGGNDSAKSIPIGHLTRKACDEVLRAALKTSLADIEKEIDQELKPKSFALPGWSASGEFQIERHQTVVKNVIGVLEGTGPLADETLVIGAHYDHVGRGGRDSLSPGSTEIHNGADDNASGTSVLLEVARQLVARKEKLPRRVVFIAFTAEESGLIGSAKYCAEPVFPLDKTIAMLNMDMVGRLSDNKLTIFGTGTAPTWPAMLEKLGKAEKFEMTFKPEGFGPSDQSSFYAKKIPVLHFFTGNHPDYHRPSDDWEKLNINGMERVSELVAHVAVETVTNPVRPEYIAIKTVANPGRESSRPYFGAIPDFGTDKPGLLLVGTGPGSPADKAGLKAGDRITLINQTKIGGLEDFDLALRKFAPGDVIEVTVVRDEKDVKVKVTLDKPR